MGTHLYWRLSNVQAPGGRVAAAEIYVRETVGGTNVSPTSITAPSDYGNIPGNACDGDPDTFWFDELSDPRNIVLQFDTEVACLELAVMCRGDSSFFQSQFGADTSSGGFNLDYSDDGSVWVNVLSGLSFGEFTTANQVNTVNTEHREPGEPTEFVRATKAATLALINFPTQGIRANFARLTVPIGASPDIRVTKACIQVVCRGRNTHPNIVDWTFRLDGHEYLVLQLQEETLLYDFHAERWYVWGSGDSPLWAVQLGQNWNANLGAIQGPLGSDTISNVVCGDGTTNALYFLDPELNEDYSSLGVEGQKFKRVITGQLLARGNAYQSLAAVEVTASDGDTVDASDLTVELTYSDDRGHTYSSFGTRTVVLGEYSPVLQWRSLGSFRAPGRLLRLTDYGALVRVDDWRVPDNG